MAKFSKDKGKRGERELAKFLTAQGYECKRGVQYQGGTDSPDVVGLPGIHLECKRTERLNLYDAMAQAIHDSGGKSIPLVAHRKNNCEWLAILRLEDFVKIYREWEAGQIDKF